MMENDSKYLMAGFSALNKILIVVLVIEAVLFYVDTRSHKKNMDLLENQKTILLKQKEQVTLLENLYHTLEQKDASMSKESGFLEKYDQDMLITLSDPDILKYMAGNNRLRVDWVNSVPVDSALDSGTDHVYVVSLKGGYSELRPLLLDLLAWPRLRNLPMIQVMALDNTLDITLNVSLYERGPAGVKEVQP